MLNIIMMIIELLLLLLLLYMFRHDFPYDDDLEGDNCVHPS